MSEKAPRIVLTLRIGEGGRDALDRIAAAKTATSGKKVTRSDVHREALAEYATRNDPARRKPR